MNENQTAIDAIIARKETVEVHGHTLVLALPSAEDIAAVRSLASQSVGVVKEDGSGDMVEGIRLFTEAQIKGIAGCLGIDEAQAGQLLAVTGGDNGALATAMRDLLGLSAPDKEDEPGADVTGPLSVSDLELEDQ